jgi:hypothetical protein
MKRRRRFATIVALAAAATVIAGAGAEAAQKRKSRPATSGFPYSIMNDEPGLRSAAPREPWLANPHRSPLTPQGHVPKGMTVQPLGHPPAPPTLVPGISGNAGPAIAPARPAGQSFQERALNCVHGGGVSGVGAGQIGTFARSCVNQ